jgi:hypothetical protein
MDKPMLEIKTEASLPQHLHILKQWHPKEVHNLPRSTKSVSLIKTNRPLKRSSRIQAHPRASSIHQLRLNRLKQPPGNPASLKPLKSWHHRHPANVPLVLTNDRAPDRPHHITRLIHRHKYAHRRYPLSHLLWREHRIRKSPDGILRAIRFKRRTKTTQDPIAILNVRPPDRHPHHLRSIAISGLDPARFPHPTLDTSANLKSGSKPKPGHRRAFCFLCEWHQTCIGSPDLKSLLRRLCILLEGGEGSTQGNSVANTSGPEYRQ